MQEKFYSSKSFFSVRTLRTNLPVFKILIWFLVFLTACSKADDDAVPIGAEPALTVLPNKTEVQPFELLTLTVKGQQLAKSSYQAKLGEKDMLLTKVEDTLLVGMVPEMEAGDYALKASVEGSSLHVVYQVKAAAAIGNPSEYLQEFAGQTDYAKYQIALDSLVERGIITQQKATGDFEALKQKEQEILQKIASTSAEQQKIAAAVIAANRLLFDEVNESLRRLRTANVAGNARTQFVEAQVKTRILEITKAAGKIGIMIGGPALLLSEWGPVGATAGAALGVMLFKNRLAAQKAIIEASTLVLFDENVVPVMESLNARFQRTTGVQAFVNGMPRRTDITLKLRNLQASDASSKTDFIRLFINGYTRFKGLWDQYMPDFGSLPDFAPLKQKEVAIDYTKVKVEVIANQAKVKGELVKESEVYKLKFTTDEIADQEFTYRLTYTLPDLDPIKFETEALLKANPFVVSIYKGDDQTAGTEKSLTDSLTVRVLDADGKPVKDFSTTWTVTTGGGVVSGAATTDAAGFSRATFKLGKAEGEHKVEVVVKDRDGKEVKNGKVTFTATAKIAYELKYIAGNNQSGQLASSLANELIVRLVDHNLLPVQGQKVQWVVVEGGGTISSANLTDASGESKATWKLGPSGPQKVEARFVDKDGKPAPGSPVTFTAGTSSILGKWQVVDVIYRTYNLDKTLSEIESDKEFDHLEFTQDNEALFYFFIDSPWIDKGTYSIDQINKTVSIIGTQEDEFNHKFNISNYSAAGFTMTTDYLEDEDYYYTIEIKLVK